MNKNHSIMIGTLIACFGFFVYILLSVPKLSSDTIKVGILHSMVGTMAANEKKLVDATLFAIEQINESGGILGKMIQPVIADGKSDPDVFMHEAERLITQEKVSVLFGCWTSASRKAVKDVIEKYNKLLFYPVEYEGIEESECIIYTGSPPSQQIIPGTIWAYKNLGTRFFLVGSDYIFPHMAHAIIKEIVMMLKGNVVGEAYIPLGSSNVSAVVDDIIRANPTVIINTINGDTNAVFVKELREQGIIPEKIPSMFFSISEPDFASFNLSDMEGDYATWSYFQSISTDANREFVRLFKKKYGETTLIGDPMETAYFGVYLWAETVSQSKSVETNIIREALRNQKYNAPGGVVYIDNKNNNTWKTTRIGKVTHNKQFNIVWDAKKPVRPLVYPPLKSKEEWLKLADIYTHKGTQ
jgi:urea transport system substrate-binding protein